MKRLMWTMLIVAAAATPGAADVIPTRRVDQNPAAERAVKARLEQLGVSATEAQHQVQALTPDEAGYFARNPERIQSAGALTWDEWVLGFVGFVFFAGVGYFFLS
jgi:hypothetical protein